MLHHIQQYDMKTFLPLTFTLEDGLSKPKFLPTLQNTTDQ